ncbi:MAG: Uma2 family endonuclease [Ferruginibacter sp.]|nr:Uma2 family endonuclease [Ferruginibacter sp.]
MNNLLQQPPKTAMEVFKILPEGTLCEVINGTLYMSPSPLSKHQLLISELLSAIHSFLKPNKTGIVFTAPFDVYLDEESNAVQPDLIIVLNENSSIIKEHIHGVPDILIEILSKGNESHDLVRKKELYETKGVKEYFIVDPTTKEVIHYIYQNNSFIPQPTVIGELDSLVLKYRFTF